MTLKIFVADDSVTIQKVIALAFSSEDAVIESVLDGESAMDSVRAFQPDVVLIDIFMPGRTGYEVCARIKDDPELCRTPVVLMVGAFEPFDESEAARVRSDGHLKKPFDPAELIQTVRSLVGDKMDPEQSETEVESCAGRDAVSDSGTADAPKHGSLTRKGFVSPRVWRSFLGSDRILDLFDSETLEAADAGLKESAPAPARQEAVTSPDAMIPSVAGSVISDDVLDAIVDRVVKRMSEEVVREVAWEVVPELSEVIIRRTLEERSKS
jgi:CheY-like chemotaxis protein